MKVNRSFGSAPADFHILSVTSLAAAAGAAAAHQQQQQQQKSSNGRMTASFSRPITPLKPVLAEEAGMKPLPPKPLPVSPTYRPSAVLSPSSTQALQREPVARIFAPTDAKEDIPPVPTMAPAAISKPANVGGGYGGSPQLHSYCPVLAQHREATAMATAVAGVAASAVPADTHAPKRETCRSPQSLATAANPREPCRSAAISPASARELVSKELGPRDRPCPQGRVGGSPASKEAPRTGPTRDDAVRALVEEMRRTPPRGTPNGHRLSERPGNEGGAKPRVRSIDASSRPSGSHGRCGVHSYSSVSIPGNTSVQQERERPTAARRTTQSPGQGASGSHGTYTSASQRQRPAESTNASAVLEDDCAEYSDRFLAGYQKHRLLGRGACAVVWLASPAEGNSDMVAIKQVAKGGTGKARADAESARKEINFGSYLFGEGGEAKISHPGIHHLATLLDFAETKRDIWLVMEYGGTSLTKTAYEIKGEFLRGERLYRVNHLPLLQAMKENPQVLKELLTQLLSALSLLAEHRIVHSDIKPDNILIEEDEWQRPKARFIDLGSAFAFDSPENLALATPEYMPPEALETCAGRGGGLGGVSLGGAARLSMTSRGTGPMGGSRRSSGATVTDPMAKLRHSQPWSFDIWSLGSIFLELCLGTPLWLSYKCRVADDRRGDRAGLGLFAVPGRDPEKILQKQSDALRQRGLPKVLHSAPGVPIHRPEGNGQGLDLLSSMLRWEPIDRISPDEALRHPWLLQEQQ